MRGACLTAGVSEADFWAMTWGEAIRACEAYQDRRRDRAYFDYTQAMAVGLFVGSIFSSKQLPKINDIYPEFFSEDAQAEQEERDSQSAANFMKMAHAINERFQNGNRESESENNG